METREEHFSKQVEFEAILISNPFLWKKKWPEVCVCVMVVYMIGWILCKERDKTSDQSV